MIIPIIARRYIRSSSASPPSIGAFPEVWRWGFLSEPSLIIFFPCHAHPWSIFFLQIWWHKIILTLISEGLYHDNYCLRRWRSWWLLSQVEHHQAANKSPPSPPFEVWSLPGQTQGDEDQDHYSPLSDPWHMFSQMPMLRITTTSMTSILRLSSPRENSAHHWPVSRPGCSSMFWGWTWSWW